MRIECPECHNQVKPRSLRLNPVKDKKVCKRCDKKIGHNRFYNPEVNGSTFKRKFTRMTLTEDEKKGLFINLIQLGSNGDSANKRIRNLQNHLFSHQRKRLFVPKTNNSKEEINKKFLEGLGQVNGK